MSRYPHSRRAAGRLAAIGLALWLGLEAAGGIAANPVPPLAVTASADITGDTARLVLAWPTKIDYSAGGGARELVLEFSRATTIDMAAAMRRLSSFIDQADVGEQGRTLRLHFARPLKARSAYEGSSIVITFEPAAPAPAEPAAAEPKAPAAAASAPVQPAGPDKEALLEAARAKVLAAAEAHKAAELAKAAQPAAPASDPATPTGEPGARETARDEPIDLTGAAAPGATAAAPETASPAPAVSADDAELRERARAMAIEAAAAAKAAKTQAPVPAPAPEPEKKPASSLPTITVKGDSGDDYGRLVFDWPSTVSYTVRREDGDEFIVAFAQAANLDVDAVNRTLPKHLRVVRAKVQNGASVVWMKLAKGASVRDVRDGKQVVLYLEKGTSHAEKSTAAAPAEKSAAAAPAETAKPAPTTGPKVKVTSSERKGYTRLVFDWPKKTLYRFKLDGDQAIVSFAKPGRIDLKKLLRKLPRNIAALQAETGPKGGLTIRITLAPGAKISDKREGRKVALKILDPKPGETPSAVDAIAAMAVPVPEPKPQLEPEVVRPARTPPPERTTFSLSAPLEFLPVAESDPSLTAAAPTPAEAAAAAPVRADPGSAQRADASAAEAEPPSSPVQLLVDLPVAGAKPAVAAALPEAAPEVAVPEVAVQEAVVPEVAVPEVAVPVPATVEPPKVAAAPIVPVEPADLTPVRVTVDGDAATLRIALPQARTAAAFQRAGLTWVLIDAPTHLELSLVRLAKHPAIGGVRQLPSETASVLLFSGAVGAPRLSREGDDWVIEMRQQAAQPNQAIAVAPGKDKPQLVLEVERPGQTVAVSDPEVGDSLLVTPVETPGLGIAAGGSWPEFQLLATIQGVAVAPLSDGVQVIPAADSITIAGPSGLIVSHTDRGSAVAAAAPEPEGEPTPETAAAAIDEAAAPAPATAQGAAHAPGRLFDLAAWRRGTEATFLDDRQSLQAEMAEAAPAQQDAARLALARFFFAHGMASEARGVLELVTTQVAAKDPEIILMRAAAALLLGDDKAAAPLLAEPSLNGEAEAEPWRGVLAVHKGAWEAAAEAFARSGALLGDYSKAVRTELRFLAAEARIRIGDPLLAGEFMDEVRSDRPSVDARAQLDFLEGLRANRVGRLVEAKRQWEQLEASPNPQIRARTLYELTLLQLKDKSITPEKAIERLEQARFLWRGDLLELAVTRQLADLYLQQGDARRALILLRGAAASFADSAEAPAVAERMSEAFADLYLKGGADKLNPLTAVALFQEFRELMPAGDKGDRMIDGLADRMVKVDLLDQAAALLDEQVQKRLQGADKARVGTRLAVIRLLDRKPDAALDALTASDAADLPAELVAERRRLEARARVEKGQGDLAVGLIAGDESADAQLLRIDIAWRGQKWAEAAAALGALIDSHKEDATKLTAEGEQLVLNNAVALSLAADHDGLKALRDRFGESMGAGPFADAFALLTSDFAETNALKPVAEQLKGVEQVEGFLAAYRKRLELASLSAPAVPTQ